MRVAAGMFSKRIAWLLNMPRSYKRLLQVVVDIFLLALSFYLALWMRWDGTYEVLDGDNWIAIAVATPVTIYVFAITGFYRAIIRYISVRAVLVMARGITVSAVTIFFTSQFLDLGVPRSVPGIYAMLAFISVGGLRFILREVLTVQLSRGRKPVLVYGAGIAGRQLVDALRRGQEYVPVALVDDDPSIMGSDVSGLKVNSPANLLELVGNMGIKLSLLALPETTRSHRRQIVERLLEVGVQVRSVPAMNDIIAGKATIAELVDVPPEDLLGRDPVTPDPDLISSNIRNRSVLVTGAGGSIGSELCRQILQQEPLRLVLYDISEPALYAINMEIGRIASAMRKPPEIIPVLGSIQSPRRLSYTLKTLNIDTVYNAAAYKHVPLVEQNVPEGIRNNVFGTLRLLEASIEAGVRSFTHISTDKAVRPTNVMGASKRLAEMICQAHADTGVGTTISMVRFGNVLGSSGSVVPLFRKQILSGGPITVTHADITRYFMSIAEAAQLVIQASALAKGGEVFLLDMGKPVKILDLAIRMARLWGYTPYMEDAPSDNGDMPIRITRLRPGEKLHEELLIGADSEATRHPRILNARERFLPLQELRQLLEGLEQAALCHDLPEIRRMLVDAGIDYSPDVQIVDPLTLAVEGTS